MQTVVFDIDGTLSFDGRQINEEIVAAIQALEHAGHRVIFASARPIRDLLPIVPEFRQNELIGANGALLAQRGVVRIRSPFAAADLALVIQLIQTTDLDYIADGSWDYAARVRSAQPILAQVDPDQLAHRISLADLDPVSKVILLNLAPPLRRRLMTELRNQTALTVVAHTDEGNLDLTAAGIDKATALETLGVTDYVAFGNDQNDRQLLAGARSGIWVRSKPTLAVPAGCTICEPTVKSVAAAIRHLI